MSPRGPRSWRYARVRAGVARRFVAGEGLEIGALHSPFPVSPAARVRYVDRKPPAELRNEYPELEGRPFVEVDVVTDGETLAGIADATQDFVIASHFLEHCEDPAGALQAHLRVLRPSGVLVLALPDRFQGIDARRSPASLEHVLADRLDAGAGSRSQHYRDWAELVDLPLGNVGNRPAWRPGGPDSGAHMATSVTPTAVAEHAKALEARRSSIHFHAWTLEEFLALLERLDLPAEVVESRSNYHEFIVVLRRTG